MSAVPSTEERVQQTARTIFAAMAGEKPGRLSTRAPAGRDDGMGHGGRAPQGGDAPLRRRLPHAAQPRRDRPPPARVLRARGRGRAGGAALGHQPHGPALARGAAGERRHPPADEGVRAALHRGPGRARRRPGPQGAARRRRRLHARRARRGHRQRSRGPRLPAASTSTSSTVSPREAASWPAVPVIDQAAWGPLPRVNLSLKITSLYSQIDPVDFEGSVAAVKDLLRPIFRKGIETGVVADAGPGAVPLPRPHARGVHVAPRRGGVPRLPRRRPRAAGVPARRRSGPRAPPRTGPRDRGRPFHLRLVKGAYWDYETVIAAQEGWPVPVFTHKPDTDAMYEKLHAGRC